MHALFRTVGVRQNLLNQVTPGPIRQEAASDAVTASYPPQSDFASSPATESFKPTVIFDDAAGTDVRGSLTADLKSRVQKVAAIAAQHAEIVDREARFPSEALEAAKAERLLGMMVPRHVGGDGASVSDVVDVCYMLARCCSSTAMIFAMHQIMVAILLRHAPNSKWHEKLLRTLAKEQLLIASSTTDGQGGGDLRASSSAMEQNGSHVTLIKSATVMSYGAEADAILTTARRSAEALPSDQALIALVKRNYELEPLMNWDTLGMRGTCSRGFTLKSLCDAEQVLPDPYHKIQAQTMMPVAHLTWSAVWTGIAAGAVERARRFVRTASRRGGIPPAAAHLTRASLTLRGLRSIVGAALQRFESAAGQEDILSSIEFQNALNLLKVNSSEMASSAVMSAMQACGLSGYRNDGDFSISRSLRDVLSSSIMINNERILASVSNASLLIEAPQTLRD